jgi:arylsulfatase A-like enzyme
MKYIHKVRCVLLIVLLLLPFGCRKNRPRQAIVILLDAARPDHFSCYGYERITTPTIDALAKDGLVFENCFTQATFTRAVLPSFLYSRYYAINIFPEHPSIPISAPRELLIRTDDQSISFTKALEHSGFLTAGISAHPWLIAESKFAREFMEFFDLPVLLEFEEKYGHPRADQVIDFALEWLEHHSDRDFLLYLHLMDTHFPHYFEDDAKYFFGAESYDALNLHPNDLTLYSSLEYSASDVRYINSLYDGSLRFTDREIGRLIQFLKDSGRLNETLLIITSDHGEFLLEQGGKVGHGDPWYDLLAKIPLIFHYPSKIKPERITAFSELVDVSPTLLGLLDVKLPRGKMLDGQNLMSRVDDKSPLSTFAFSRKAIRTERYKCIFHENFRTLMEEKAPGVQDLSGELYDVVNDPGEENNLFVSQPEIVENLLAQFREKMRPLFLRYYFAESTLQPEFPFAISSRHFKTNLDIPKINGSQNSNQLKTKESPTGWLQEMVFPNFGLYATHAAQPLKVTFEIPDGEYFLSADINGSCRIVINGQMRRLRSEKFKNRLRWKSQSVEFGPIVIENKVFSATIYPDSKERWFGLRLFGFEPVIAGKRKRLESDVEERLDRLRTLGYIK